MESFPADFELVGFFEVEPTLLDADVPAIYNRVTYTTTRGDEEVRCHIERASGEIDVQWLRRGLTVGSFALRHVVRLEIAQTPSEEFLAASFQRDGVGDFRLWLRPSIRVEWGMDD